MKTIDSMNMDELLRKYSDLFGEAFPMFGCPGDENDIIQSIRKCIKTQKPYEPTYDPKLDY